MSHHLCLHCPQLMAYYYYYYLPPTLCCCVSMLSWFPSLLLLFLWTLFCSSLLLGLMFVQWFMYMCVCCVWLYEMSQFFGSVLQNVTSVYVLLLTTISLRNYLIATHVCLICFVLCMDSLPAFITNTQWYCHWWSLLLSSLITLCVHGPHFPFGQLL